MHHSGATGLPFDPCAFPSLTSCRIALLNAGRSSGVREVMIDALAYLDELIVREGVVDGYAAVISRTGYTGEDGFELYVATEAAAPLWRRLLLKY